MDEDQKYADLLELLARTKNTEGFDPAGLRDVIRKELERGDKTFGIFSDLVESLQDIIPREKQRYNAAIKALGKTSGLNRQNIIDSADKRLADLGKVEAAAASALSGLNDGLDAMAARTKIIRSEVADLRRRITELEKEEQEVLADLVRKERQNKALEEAVKKVFIEVGAGITEVRAKIEEHAAEQPPAPQPPPQTATPPKTATPPPASSAAQAAPRPRASTPPPPAVEAVEPSSAPDGNGIEPVFEETLAEPEAEPKLEETLLDSEAGQKFEETLLERDDESPEAGIVSDEEAQTDAGEETEETGIGDDLEIQLEMAKGMEEPPQQQDGKWMKKCPLCGGQMNFHLNQSLWMCYTCGNEESQADGGAAPAPPPAPETARAAEPAARPPVAESAAPPEPAPSSGPVSVAEFIPTQSSSKPAGRQPQTKKKACPVCRKQMTLHEAEGTWKCPHCNYQRRNF